MLLPAPGHTMPGAGPPEPSLVLGLVPGLSFPSPYGHAVKHKVTVAVSTQGLGVCTVITAIHWKPRVVRRRTSSPLLCSPLLCSVGTVATLTTSTDTLGTVLPGAPRQSSDTVHARVPLWSAATPQSAGQLRAGPHGRDSLLCGIRRASRRSCWAGIGPARVRLVHVRSRGTGHDQHQRRTRRPGPARQASAHNMAFSVRPGGPARLRARRAAAGGHAPARGPRHVAPHPGPMSPSRLLRAGG
jgi:hypothetical protein